MSNEAVTGCDCDGWFGDKHAPQCGLATMMITKAAFVDAAESAARHAFESYLICLDIGDFSPNESRDMVIEEVRESASCYAGIGPCGGGGCKHG